MENVVVRPAEIRDAPEIATIHVKTWQSAYKGQIPDDYLDSLSVEKRTETWKKQLENPEKGIRYFVVEDQGQVVGWSTGGVSRDEDATPEIGELYAIYVLPDHSGKGLGSKLMDQVLNTLREDGYNKATLWVLDTNKPTISWYEAKG